MMAAPAKRGAPERPDRDVRRLGTELGARVEDVLRRAAALGRDGKRGSQPELDAAVLESFERIGRGSTAAVAHWMAGGSPEAGRTAGREAWDNYGQLAAHSAAPLDAVTKRCLRWRDAMIEILTERAAELDVPSPALAQAVAMTQRT